MNRIVWSKKRAIITIAMCAILAVSSIMFLQLNQTTEAAVINPHPGLLGWWRFDEGAGNVASDSSGNGNNGTVIGATWVAGKYEQALSFDGTISNYISVPNLNLASGAFSISIWVKPESTGSYRTIMGFDLNNRFLLASNGHLLTQFDGNFFSTGTVTNGIWNFVVYVFDGLKEYWYINGQFDTQHSTTLPTWNAAFFVGQFDRVHYPFKGVIDEIQFYNRALSAVEIQENFQRRPDLSSNILAKMPKGTTQIITTLSWQGIGSINATLASPAQNYTEDMMSMYQKTSYSTSGGLSSMLNIKRLSTSVPAMSSDENWHIMLDLSGVEDYSITVEVQK